MSEDDQQQLIKGERNNGSWRPCGGDNQVKGSKYKISEDQKPAAVKHLEALFCIKTHFGWKRKVFRKLFCSVLPLTNI